MACQEHIQGKIVHEFYWSHLVEVVFLAMDSRVDFFEIHRYFSKIAGISADTAVNLLRTADAPLR